MAILIIILLIVVIVAFIMLSGDDGTDTPSPDVTVSMADYMLARGGSLLG